MGRKNVDLEERGLEEAIEFSRKISETVVQLYKRKGYTQAKFASEIGYRRSSLCQILHATESARLWRLPAICAAARVLGLSPIELLTIAAATEVTPDVRAATLSLVTMGTESGSPERFTLIVEDAVADLKRANVKEECSYEFISLSSKELVADYAEGKLSDLSLYERVKVAVELYPDVPVWAAIAKSLLPED